MLVEAAPDDFGEDEEIIDDYEEDAE
jgi:hypothetical protein